MGGWDGLRRSDVMSVSSEADAEGGEWPVGVAAVVAQRGGEVDRPGPAERADGQVAQAGYDLRAGPGPAWEASSAKVTSRTSCRPFSIVQCPRIRSASRPGLAWAWGRLVTA
jgi:hypothetical protein